MSYTFDGILNLYWWPQAALMAEQSCTGVGRVLFFGETIILYKWSISLKADNMLHHV